MGNSEKKKVQTHDRLQDLYDTLGIPGEQKADFTLHRLESVHPKPYKSAIFRANYYSFVFISTGQTAYTLDNKTYPTQPRTLYFTNPGHLKGFEIIKPSTGYLITMTEAFLKQNVHPDVFRDFPFLLAETVPPRYLDEAGYGEMMGLVRQIEGEMQAESAYKFRIVGNLFVVLLLKIKEQFWADYDPMKEADRGSLIVADFKRNLESTYRQLDQHPHLPNVQDYAALQQLHPNYLNTVIRNKTGKSAHNWITEKTLAEAQALLARSPLSIKEIAFQLKFSEPSHFSKFFKKHCGATPNAYRKSTKA